MPTKSIIEIDVNDARFLAFKKLHDAYTASLKAAPAAWAAANTKMQQSTAIARQQLTVTQQLVRSIGQMPGALSRSAAGWGAIDRVTLRIAASVGRITTSVLRWGGIGGLLGGLLGLGGLFGIEDLAQGAAGRRRRALGLGTGFGGLQSFGAFGRFVGPDFLEAVAGARMDVTRRVGLLGAGLNAGQIGAGDTATTGVALLQQLKRIADTTNPALFAQVIQARRLGDFVSPEDLLRLRNTSRGEFAGQLAQQAEFARRLRVDDSVLRKWQDLTTNLEFAGKMINKTFVTGLVPLAGPISKLSAAVTDVVASFLDAASKKHWIEDLGNALEKFAKYVATPEFDQGVKNFVHDLGVLGAAIGKAASFIGGLFGVSGARGADIHDRARRAAMHRQGIRTPGELRAARASGRETALGQLAGIFTGGQRGLTEDQLLGIVRQSERSGDAAVSPAGAIGRYQIMPTTAEQFGVSRRQLFDPAVNEMVARRYLAQLIKRYHGDTDAILAAYNAGPGRADRFVTKHDLSTLPLETRKYVTGAHSMTGYAPTVVTIENNTGGNSNVSINGLKN